MTPQSTISHPMVFTDMDGTLLDHFTYEYDAALPMLDALRANEIPVIANTSKTYDEVIAIYQELNLQCPFIVENGAAIYIPVDYFPNQPQGTFPRDGYWVKTFANSRDYYIQILNELGLNYQNSYRSFSSYDDNELAELTGLTPEQANLANRRQYSEPLLWSGTRSEQCQFSAELLKHNVYTLQGGRFLHLSGDCNKGKAMQWLSSEIQNQRKLPNVTTIALGDSGNDVAMLEAADIAVLIKSPTHSYPMLDTDKAQFIYQSQGQGPIGWHESLSFLLNITPNGGRKYG